MTLAKSITIPIAFISEAPIQALAVDELGFRKMVGFENKTPEAARQASWRFRSKHHIRTLPGGVYSIAEIQNALKPSPARRRIS